MISPHRQSRVFRLRRAHLPWYTIILIMVSVLWVDFNHSFWKSEADRVIFWDVKNYYAYLPAAIIYHDIGMGFKDADPERFHDKIWVIPAREGRYVNKMSMGLALAYAPFFLLAHAVAGPLGYEADGYSVPYKFMLVMSSAAYLLLGMVLLVYLLRRWFDPVIQSLTLIGITVGTNLFFYATIEAPMSHVYSFALFSAFMLLTVSWHTRPALWKSLLIGLCLGWISLIRPTNLIIMVVFLFWGISEGGLRLWFSGLRRHFHHLVLIGLAAGIVWLPQLGYWHYTTGAWLFWSYGGERFFFDSPEIINGLFSYRKGWLLYTPIMSFALFGILLLRKQLRPAFLAILLFTLLNIYIVLSWWSWWYGGSFGLRAFIDSYAILAIPMAMMLDWLRHQRTKLWKGISLGIFGLLIAHSVFQTMQYYYGSIHWDSMTKEAYWDSFLRLRPSPVFYDLLEPPPGLDEVLEEKGTTSVQQE